MIAWSWTVELDSARAVSKAQIKRKVSKLALVRNVYMIRSQWPKLAHLTKPGWNKTVIMNE